MKLIKPLSLLIIICGCFMIDNKVIADEEIQTMESSDTSEMTVDSSQGEESTFLEENEISDNEPILRAGNQGRSTIPSDTFSPDKKGIQILIPIRIGFVSQPQPIQYIVKSQQANLGFKTTSWGPILGKYDSTLYYWKQNEEDGSWSQRQVYGNYKSDRGSIVGSYRQATGIRINLDPGVYYFQVETRLNIIPILPVKSTYHSNLARVEVYEKAIPTEKLSIKAPQVIFNNAIYPVSAVTTPKNATTKITWVSDFTSQGLEFLAEDGRNNEIGIESMPTTVNTDVTKPGLPFTITATANDFDNATKNATETVYLGGLAAKIQAPSDDFTWELDSQGLTDLDEAIDTEATWSYTWKFYDYKGKELTGVSDNIDNLSGTVNNLSDLNADNKIIMIKNNSSLMKKAHESSEKGQDISAQVVLSTTIITDPDEGTTETVTMSSNRASLTVRKPPEELTLKQVPSFSFGSIPVNYIYEGTGESVITSSPNMLEVIDTRDNSVEWSLSASMTKFKSTNNTELTSINTITINNTNLNTIISDDGIAAQIMQSNKTQKLTVTGELGLGPNPMINLQQNEVFSSIITWNLISADVKANPL